MKKLLVLLICLSFQPAIAENNDVSIKAELAEYNGDELVLRDHALVQFGHSYISADIMTLKMKNRHLIQDIVAENSVSIVYHDDFSAVADYAHYQYSAEVADASKQRFPGTVILKTTSDPGVCKLSNPTGDVIHAKQIEVNTVLRTFTFDLPNGELTLNDKFKNDPASSKGNIQIQFSADTMTWDPTLQVLTLSGNVKVNQGDLGMLTADDRVEIFKEKINGKEVLKSIVSHGKTVMTYYDKEHDVSHILTSNGTMRIDHQSLQTVLESPTDSDGNIMEGQQVHFTDPTGEMYADKLILDYDFRNHKLIPLTLKLVGHVHILNQFSSSDSNSPLLQYALADTADYDFGTKMMSLSGNEGNRVLFFDKINNIQVSAPSLKVKRDPLTKKESVQGVGDVRFTFIKHELDQINERFHLGKDKHE